MVAAPLARQELSRHSRPSQPQADDPLDKQRYQARHLIENAFCLLKDFRHVASRYDKLGGNSLSAVALATVISFWP